MATRSPLGTLINSARTPEGLSLQDIADRATRRGVPMSKQNVSRLANDYPLASVSGDNIKGLAIALGISERRVASAALEALGVEATNQATPLRQAILDSDQVGERTKRILLSIIQDDEDEADLVASLNAGNVRHLGKVTASQAGDGVLMGDESFGGPEPGVGLAADNTGEPSMKERVIEEQENADEDNQDPDGTDQL